MKVFRLISAIFFVGMTSLGISSVSEAMDTEGPSCAAPVSITPAQWSTIFNQYLNSPNCDLMSINQDAHGCQNFEFDCVTNGHFGYALLQSCTDSNLMMGCMLN